MPFEPQVVTLTSEERIELAQMTQSRTRPAGNVFRARLILMLADQFSYRTLYAALDVQTGKVLGKTAARHTSDEFVAFLDEVLEQCKPDQEVHIILDNLSAHKTNKVGVFLQDHPNVKLHFTPTYSSWLNQVEIWFGRIEREVIARGVFSSVRDLARKLMRYILAYSKTARPFRWKYSDLRHRVRVC